MYSNSFFCMYSAVGRTQPLHLPILNKSSFDMSKIEKPVSTLWGCELSDSHKSETFKINDTDHEHQLALRTLCLGPGAKDEFNIVEVITGEENNKAVPMVTLHANGMPTVALLGMDLHPPVTFRLKSGAGPVYICAEHVALDEDYSAMSDEEMDGEEEEDIEEEEEEEEESPEKPVKKPAKNGAAAARKRKKPEDGPTSDENPPKKEKGRGRGKKN